MAADKPNLTANRILSAVARKTVIKVQCLTHEPGRTARMDRTAAGMPMPMCGDAGSTHGRSSLVFLDKAKHQWRPFEGVLNGLGWGVEGLQGLFSFSATTQSSDTGCWSTRRHGRETILSCTAQNTEPRIHEPRVHQQSATSSRTRQDTSSLFEDYFVSEEQFREIQKCRRTRLVQAPESPHCLFLLRTKHREATDKATELASASQRPVKAYLAELEPETRERLLRDLARDFADLNIHL